VVAINAPLLFSVLLHGLAGLSGTENTADLLRNICVQHSKTSAANDLNNEIVRRVK
jgi:hypothetical protein